MGRTTGPLEPALGSLSARIDPLCGGRRLLECHRDAEALLVADQVVVVVGAGVELDPSDGAVEVPVLAGVVLADGGAGVVADVAGLVAGVEHRDGRGDLALADLAAVDVERGGSAL